MFTNNYPPHIIPVQPLIYPVCEKRYHGEMDFVGGDTNWETGEMEPVFACHYCVNGIYLNHCWNCKSIVIDSRTCIKSVVPHGGYHCPVCGVDLFGNVKFKTN